MAIRASIIFDVSELRELRSRLEAIEGNRTGNQLNPPKDQIADAFKDFYERNFSQITSNYQQRFGGAVLPSLARSTIARKEREGRPDRQTRYEPAATTSFEYDLVNSVFGVGVQIDSTTGSLLLKYGYNARQTKAVKGRTLADSAKFSAFSLGTARQQARPLTVPDSELIEDLAGIYEEFYEDRYNDLGPGFDFPSLFT